MKASDNKSPPANSPVDSLNIGIIAGGGALPGLVADCAIASGHDVHLIGIEDEADETIGRFPHDWIKWGQIGRLLGILRGNGCSDVVIIGTVRRPDLARLRLDIGGIRSLPLLLGALTGGGDDAVLTTIVRFFEHHGMRVRGAHEIAPELLAGEGLLAGPKPGRKSRGDISLGLEVIAALGRLDIGQAAVVARQYVLGVEAAEGTDELLRRCSDLRQWGNSWFQRKRVGVLVKGPKPGQELRVDMPTVGPNTISLLADAGLAGLAVTAGGVLLVEREKTCRLADEAGVFILGIEQQDNRSGEPPPEETRRPS